MVFIISESYSFFLYLYCIIAGSYSRSNDTDEGDALATQKENQHVFNTGEGNLS